MDRRIFIRNGAMACAAMMIHDIPAFGSTAIPIEYPGLAAASNADPYLSARAVVEAMGGMGRFVRPGSITGFLINSAFDVEGAYTSPDVAIAVVEMAKEAGAGEIIFLQPILEDYWKRSKRYKSFRKLLPEITQVTSNVFPSTFNETDFRNLTGIKGALHLQNIEIIRKIFEIDSFINMPIGKHHPSTLYTGALKNMMGLTTRKTNVAFHLGSGVKNDPAYLAECIADLNLVRKPDLVVTDSVKVLVTNGPSGPGETVEPGKVFATADPVAADAYGAKLIGYEPAEILAVQKAASLAIGEADLDKVQIVELGI